ncbi:hypothetical protein [Sphingomonas folli]|uniref:hypothetical protein n=1 Tax=Sphingomonas folli TaxID=2862497 RepID=UPI0027E5709F|nr:hypothetical protein [Sphingomonas folli]
MSVALALLLQASPLAPPTDWGALQQVPLLRRWEPGEQVIAFVRGEVRAGRCATPDTNRVTVDFVVFLGAEGQVRRIVPRAIDCPTVEQYASGLTLRAMRGNVADVPAAGWYRSSITFDWS